MNDFIKFQQPNGTLYTSTNDKAKNFVAGIFNMLADPILDEEGATLFESVLAKSGFTFIDGDAVPMNDGLGLWTADEVAECLSLRDDDLYKKLYGFLNDASNPTPLGGDGSNGTVECPGARYDADNDDKAPHWWSKLTRAEQTKINAAYVSEFGSD